MKRILILVILLAATASWAGDTSKLVEVGKANKPKRKASTTKVITDKDVKKSKGKLIVLPAKPLPPAAKPAAGPGAIAQQDARHHSRVEVQSRIDTATKNVSQLEKQLETTEQRYYEENDPSHRDDVIRNKFAETKRKLEGARKELADARDAMQRIDKP